MARRKGAEIFYARGAPNTVARGGSTRALSDMDAVPNAAFDATFPADAEFEHPPGCYLARKLLQSLSSIASAVDDFDNWRDTGWVVTCEVDGKRFEVYFGGIESASAPNAWMLAIAPLGRPGALRKLFGAKDSAYTAQSKLLAMHVHRILANDAHVSNLRWAMNSDPTDGKATDPNSLSWGDANVA